MKQVKCIAAVCCAFLLVELGGVAWTAPRKAAHSISASSPLTALAPALIDPPAFDPFEPVTSQPQALETSDALSSARDLLQRGFSKSIFVAGIFTGSKFPYAATIAFSGSGQVQDVGPGEMDDTQNAAGDRRWIGNIGNFSLNRILKGRFAYDLGSTGLPIPIRLHMVRANVLDIDWPKGHWFRTAEASVNGISVNCILNSSLGKIPVAAGRDWWEAEYCFDSKTEELRVYSAVPGIYYIYDYPNSSDFHGHTVPDRFTVAEGGETALQGTISLKTPNPNELDPGLFTVTDRMFRGGVRCSRPSYVRILSLNKTAVLSQDSLTPIQRVIVHAILAPDGAVVEAESLQTPDAPFSQSAVELVRKTKFEPSVDSGDPTQREIFVYVE